MTKFIVCLLAFLIIGCTQFHYKLKTFGYGDSELNIKRTGIIDDSYELYPLVKLDEGLYVKLLPFAPYLLEDKECHNSNKFILLLWTKQDISMGMKNIYIQKGARKYIASSVRVGQGEDDITSSNGILASNFSENDEITSLMNAELFQKKHSLQINFPVDLGCPNDQYQFNFSWNDGSKTQQKSINLYPLIYEKVSR